MLPLRIALNSLLMGSIPIWIKLTSASSSVIAVARLSLGAGLTLAFFWRRLALRRAFAEQGLWMFLLGACFAVHWYTYFEAIRRTSPTLGLLSLSTFGIHVTWMSVLFGTKRATAMDWIGVGLAALGAFVCAPKLSGEGDLLIGFLFGMTSALFYATIPHLHRHLADYPHATRSVAQLGIAWLLFLPTIPFSSFGLAERDWLILGVLGVFCTFIAHNLWISVTTEVRPQTSGLLYYLSIPVAMGFEWFVFHRPPATNQLVGAGLIASGNLSAYWLHRRTTAAVAPAA